MKKQQTNNKFVVIDTKAKSYHQFEGRVSGPAFKSDDALEPQFLEMFRNDPEFALKEPEEQAPVIAKNYEEMFKSVMIEFNKREDLLKDILGPLVFGGSIRNTDKWDNENSLSLAHKLATEGDGYA